MNNFILLIQSGWSSRNWPHHVIEPHLLDLEQMAGWNETSYTWKAVIRAADREVVVRRLEAGRYEYQFAGYASPVPTAPPLLWANTDVAWAVLMARYPERIAAIECYWTAQEAADYRWLYRHETQPASWEQGRSRPELALQDAHWSYCSRKSKANRRPDEDDHYLAVLNATRIRAGLYPRDHSLNNIYEEFESEEGTGQTS